MIKYILILVALTVAVSCIVPLMQFIYSFYRFSKRSEKLLFSQSLLDYDLDDIRYEDVHEEGSTTVGRQLLANRGWVRCPNGTIMNSTIFEAKKAEEYAIELP